MIRRNFSLGLVLILVIPALRADDNRARRREMEKMGNWWRTYDGIDFPATKFVDGDSFHLMVPVGTGKQDWPIRLYGIDCPETDVRFPERLKEQATAMGLPDNAAVLRWGEKAKARTVELLKQAKGISLYVKRDGKEKTRQAGGQAQRYYGIVELQMPDGEILLLHKTLLREGLAISGAEQAPWPPDRVAKDGEKDAGKDFMRENERAAKEAKREKAGIWSETPVPGKRAKRGE